MANEKTTNAANGSLFRVNYKYIAANAQLRTGALVLEAKSAEDAKKAAEESLATANVRGYRIASVKLY